MTKEFLQFWHTCVSLFIAIFIDLYHFFEPALLAEDAWRIFFVMRRFKRCAALVAGARRKPEFFDPLIELLLDSAERAPPRERQVHSAEKGNLLRDNPESARAGVAADDFVK